MARIRLLGWLNRKVVDPLLQTIRRGVEPKQLAFSTALGITLGLFPICGVTVLLCGMAIALLRTRCHAPSVMLANFVATPIELRKHGEKPRNPREKLGKARSHGKSLVVPFLRFGEIISGGARFPLTSDALWKVVTGQASREVLLGVFHALLGWFVAAPFILGLLYVAFLPCSKYLVNKFSTIPGSPKKQVHPQSEILLKIRDV